MIRKLLMTLLLSLSACLFGCQNDTPPDGRFDMRLTIQGKKIPFQLNFKSQNTVELINGPETIHLSYEKKDSTILIPVLNFDAQLILEQEGNSLKGTWSRPNKVPAYAEPIAGRKTSNPMTLPDYPFPFKWKMELIEKGKTTEAILLFTADGDGKYASVLTQTGDYRYLTPQVENGKLILTGFDGIFAFYFEGELKGNNYNGTMYAGKSWNQPFKAVVDRDFELPDPTKATRYSGNLEKLKLPRLKGSEETVINQSNKGKVNVVQIFGSWCPNCIDETRFINQWRKENPGKDVSFSMIAFERSPNKKHAIKSLEKARKLHEIDYPIYIGGYTADEKVSRVLPEMENFISFPTTLILDKKGNVRKVHAGFTGPATGKYYEKFILDFNSLMEKLLAE